MKKFILIAALGLALAGCGQTAGDIATSITTVTASVKEKAQVAQGRATTICGYVPTIATLISIFNSGFSNDVSTVANAVCNAVTSLPLADGPGDRKPRVNGIVIKGAWAK